MGLRWPRKPQNVENFIGRYDKLSRAAKGEVSRENKNIVVHQGVIGLQDSFYRIQIGSRVSEIRLLTPLFLFLMGCHGPWVGPKFSNWIHFITDFEELIV
jgi:hypothetical protein